MCGFYDSIETALGVVIVTSWLVLVLSAIGAEFAAPRWMARSPSAPEAPGLGMRLLGLKLLLWPRGARAGALASDPDRHAAMARSWLRAYRLGVSGSVGSCLVLVIFHECP